MNQSIDLNCDMGESFGAWRMGNDAALMDVVSSINVACGFHAGDATTMQKAKVCIVVAISQKRRAIGFEGKLLWHISEDLQRFKTLTVGHPVIMGRKTFESIVSYIGKPLPERTNIVVTRNTEFSYPGVVVVRSLGEALLKAHGLDSVEVHIGGGADIYAQALPHIDRLYLTIVNDEPAADTFFPPYETEFTKVLDKEKHETTEGLVYEWVTRERS